MVFGSSAAKDSILLASSHVSTGIALSSLFNCSSIPLSLMLNIRNYFSERHNRSRCLRFWHMSWYMTFSFFRNRLPGDIWTRVCETVFGSLLMCDQHCCPGRSCLGLKFISVCGVIFCFSFSPQFVLFFSRQWKPCSIWIHYKCCFVQFWRPTNVLDKINQSRIFEWYFYETCPTIWINFLPECKRLPPR